MSEETRERYAVVDMLRGLALVNMVAYHAVWDLVYLYGVSWQWFLGTPGALWQQAICCTFIFVSGFSQPWSRQPIYRGAVVFLWGLAVTVVTLVVMPQAVIIFGVLTCIGTCMLLFGLAAPLFRHLTRHAGVVFIGSMLCFLGTRSLVGGSIGFGPWQWTLPKSLQSGWLSTFLGWPMSGFFSADYFPLLPWLFLFAAGWALHQLMAQKNVLHVLAPRTIPPLEWCGRYTLWIYLAHQPVITLLLRMALG